MTTPCCVCGVNRSLTFVAGFGPICGRFACEEKAESIYQPSAGLAKAISRSTPPQPQAQAIPAQ